LISIACPLLAPYMLNFQKEQIMHLRSDEEDIAEVENNDFENE